MNKKVLELHGRCYDIMLESTYSYLYPAWHLDAKTNFQEVNKLSSFKRLIIAVLIAASVVYVAGCTSSQTTNQSQGDAQAGYGQPASQTQAQPPAQTQTQASYQDIDAAQAKQVIDTDKTLQIIDVREDYEYAEGHIQGSKLIPLGQLTSRMGEIDKAKPVLFVCASGARSASAAQVLIQSGYSKVYNLAGGIEQWTYGVVK